ncbi:unnamed protein product [Rotaria socialis]|uniref:Uncharacterized protein n=1 Tax=Rotaria socialis TaxID=392032 RepID=A0A820UH94_9BILA|nr:unnamed protein product [Rotaria socialis]CAF4548631.1 unnamed protein product [Rotaria socialis]
MSSILYVIIYLLSLSVLVDINAQTCKDAVQYEQCSSNIGCGCLPLINTDNSSICAFLHIKCSELSSCANNNRTCYKPDHLCVKHSRCHSAPLCYPADMTIQALCPPSTTIVSPPVVPDDGICANATWDPNGVTVAGGNGEGSELNQLRYPWGFFVDDDAAVYVADTWNFRVIKIDNIFEYFTPGASSGRVVAGGNGNGQQPNQLKYAASIIYYVVLCVHSYSI